MLSAIKLTKTLTCISLLLGLCSAAQAEISIDLAKEILQKNGGWLKNGGMAKAVIIAFEPMLDEVKAPKKARDDFAAMVYTAYADDLFNNRVAKEVAMIMKPMEAKDVLAWVNSEAGIRVSQAEQRYTDSLDIEKKEKEGARTRAKASPQRRALLEEIFRQSSTPRVELYYNTCHAAGLARGTAEIEQPGNQQIVALIEQTRAQQQAMINDQLKERQSDYRKRNAFMYGDLSENDLRALLAHKQTAGYKTIVQGLANGLCSAAEKAGYVFGRMNAINRPAS